MSIGSVSISFLGSPPRGRGKVTSAFFVESRTGITPAWAGKRSSLDGKMFKIWDHPRVGGEKTKGGGPEKSGLGSPPRGRGKVGHSVISTISSGITPAWAGKSLFDMVINSLLEDHPRVGGEKFQKPIDMLQDMGSPPRGRGKVLEFALVFRWCRITPAWAGKRLKRSHRSGIFISGPIPFHSVLHRPAGSGGSRAGRDGSPAGQPQNTGPA